MGYSIERLSGKYIGQEHMLLVDHLPKEFCVNTSIRGFLTRFRNTSWGGYQAEQPVRYSANFGYGNEQMLNDLGDRVHPIDHNEAAHNDYVAFLLRLALLEELDVDPREVLISRIAVILHDVGESTHKDLKVLCGGVIGDIPFGRKTPEDRALERELLEKVISTLFADLPEDVRNYAIDFITHAPEIKDGLLHKIFEASHDWGEYETGLRAGQLAFYARQEGRQLDRREIQLARIGLTVTERMKPRLQAASDEFPFIDRMLEEKYYLHKQIHEELYHDLTSAA